MIGEYVSGCPVLLVGTKLDKASVNLRQIEADILNEVQQWKALTSESVHFISNVSLAGIQRLIQAVRSISFPPNEFPGLYRRIEWILPTLTVALPMFCTLEAFIKSAGMYFKFDKEKYFDGM